MLRSSRDNWERLVAAVIRREEDWQLAHAQSRSPSISTLSSESSRNLSRQISSYADDASVSPLRLVPVPNSSPSTVSSSSSGTIKQRGIPGGATSILKVPRNMIAALYRRRKVQHYNEEYPSEVYSRGLKRFSQRELQIATDKFNDRNFIGRVGYSKFYKGRLMDGSVVAVKRLTRIETDREHLFQSELEILSEVFHPNIVRLLGFCVAKSEWWLVYPFMSNGSVASCLRERSESQPPLDWPTRMRIATGAARGLAYLHGKCDPKIIHRNVKATNILLDENLEAVVGDFEIMKLLEYDDAYVETAVRGTPGHVAPEYLTISRCSEKTDVFAYGIFLLELITKQTAFDRAGLANSNDRMLLSWVRRLVREKRWETLVDSDLQGNYVEVEMEQLLKLAFLCTRRFPEERPKMSEIVRMLETGDGLFGRLEDWLQEETFDQVYIASMYSHFFLHSAAADHEDPSNIYGGHLRRFLLGELEVVTEKFSNRNIIGRGGFGKVYRGRLEDGSLVAVKRLRKGNNGRPWFQISNMILHQNILPLLGFCIAQEETLLVYPFMTNGTVALLLRDRSESQPLLEWETRIRIAIGTARGLAYLHEQWGPKIIHRDIKAANILLDDDFEAVLSGFGIAKLMDHNDDDVETAVRGTIGHIAPEYLATGRCSEKTDVYAYGMFLLELITAQRAFDLARLANDDDVMLLDWVKELVTEARWDTLVDANLQGKYEVVEVEKLLQLALLCTRPYPRERPKMSEVMRMLETRDHGLVGIADDQLHEETSNQEFVLQDEDWDQTILLPEEFDSWWEERQAEDMLREDPFGIVT